MVSVIVPVYRVEKYLKKCVESIINQTYKDIEVILIDDGSPDNCGRICDELALCDERIKVIHQNNGGLAAARNRGLEYVMGNNRDIKNHYITFVDSDDTINKNMYKIMIDEMEKENDIVICNHRIVKEKDVIASCTLKKSKSLDQDGLWEEVFGRLNNAVWNKLYRADLIGELRFPVGIIHGEDLIFNIQYLTKCKKGVFNESELYNYTKREGSITTGKFDDNKLMEVIVKDEAKRLIEQYYPKQMKNAKKYCFRARMNMLRGIYKNKQEKRYLAQIKEYREYVRDNYKEVKSVLHVKEKIEYFLIRKYLMVYRKLIKFY
ncbi:glycosyltransferase family 2 protein [Faecalimonas umbilicata]|uniref:glycosyltransferase family 2 protein n=1 Tax=Faecalimonas umbilicata TaxID=1912855 RepID=UPI0022E7E976|nr:glycosyltransferase [Faecalimonas umbilicata]